MQGARNPSLSVLANEDQKVWGWKRTCNILRDGTWLTREPPCRFLNNLFYMFLHGRRLVCFSSNLHVTGFSSCRITTMIHSYLVWFLWWLRHGAIGPSEATLFVVNVDWIDFRIYTFESVIRLSKVQQWALLLSTVFGDSRCSGCPLWTPWNAFLLSEAVPNIQKLPFALAALVMTVALQHAQGSRQAHDFQVWFFSFVGCLVRWNILCT